MSKKYVVYSPTVDVFKRNKGQHYREDAETACDTLKELTMMGYIGYHIYELVPVEEVVVTTRTMKRIEE